MPGTPADVSCLQVADGLRWLAGLETPHHNWSTLVSLGVAPARVVNVSRAFPSLMDPTLSHTAREYLVETLQKITTSAHNGLGALVVITLENSPNLPFMEDRLSLPCRNSILVVGPCRGASGTVSSARLGWGPVVSIVAPSNELKLLSVPNSGRNDCGVFSGPAASFSTAMVTAAAATVLAARSDLSAEKLATILRHTASLVDVEIAPEEDRPEDNWFAMRPDRTQMAVVPNGAIPQLGQASLVGSYCWTSLRYGHGTVDTSRAIDVALTMS